MRTARGSHSRGPGRAPTTRRGRSRSDTLAQRRQFLVRAAVVLSNSGVAAEQVLGELPRLEGVDAAFMAFDRRRRAVRRAFGLEARPRRPADVVPGEGFEPVEVVVPAHVPKPPGDDRLDEGRARAHAGTGSWAGSSTGAGEGTGSSSGAISISCSVSGAPISIGSSWSFSSEIRGKSYRAIRTAQMARFGHLGLTRQRRSARGLRQHQAVARRSRLLVKDGDALRISGFQTIK